jgi:hypothetical protein
VPLSPTDSRYARSFIGANFSTTLEVVLRLNDFAVSESAIPGHEPSPFPGCTGRFPCNVLCRSGPSCKKKLTGTFGYLASSNELLRGKRSQMAFQQRISYLMCAQLRNRYRGSVVTAA